MNEMLPIFSTKVTHLYKKSRSTKPETARILVTVKARPEPSKKYGETVAEWKTIISFRSTPLSKHLYHHLLKTPDQKATSLIVQSSTRYKNLYVIGGNGWIIFCRWFPK